MRKQIYYLIIFNSKFYFMKETALNLHCHMFKAGFLENPGLCRKALLLLVVNRARGRLKISLKCADRNIGYSVSYSV